MKNRPQTPETWMAIILNLLKAGVAIWGTDLFDMLLVNFTLFLFAFGGICNFFLLVSCMNKFEDESKLYHVLNVKT